MGLISTIESMDPATLKTRLALANVVNACILIMTGVLSFVLDLVGSPTGVILSVYTILFGIVLILFHTPIRAVQVYLITNFGFMFHWTGRCSFLFFIGFITLSLGTVGYVCSAVTFCNVLLSGVALRYNPGLRREFHTGQMAKGAVFGKEEENKDVRMWEEVIDPDSGETYFYNPQTGETQWERPTP